MKRFIFKILIFVLPLIGYILLVVFIDPYNLFRKGENTELAELKNSIPNKLNYPLFKLIKFDNEPTKTVLLGDSRTNKLHNSYFNNFTDGKVTNLSYGGGTLPEIINTFWEISRYSELDKVIIGINFNLYNANNCTNRVKEAVEIKNSYIEYLTCSYTMKSTFYICKSIIFNDRIEIERPPLSKEKFWNYQLDVAATNFYRTYIYPQEYYIQLKEISEYCHFNNISLSFFIPPTHIDLQNKILEFNLLNEEKVFKRDLSSLGEVYDFDYSNKLTSDKRNFSDPFHCIDSIAKIVAEDIINGKGRSSSHYKYWTNSN